MPPQVQQLVDEMRRQVTEAQNAAREAIRIQRQTVQQLGVNGDLNRNAMDLLARSLERQNISNFTQIFADVPMFKGNCEENCDSFISEFNARAQAARIRPADSAAHMLLKLGGDARDFALSLPHSTLTNFEEFQQALRTEYHGWASYLSRTNKITCRGI